MKVSLRAVTGSDSSPQGQGGGVDKANPITATAPASPQATGSTLTPSSSSSSSWQLIVGLTVGLVGGVAIAAAVMIIFAVKRHRHHRCDGRRSGDYFGDKGFNGLLVESGKGGDAKSPALIGWGTSTTTGTSGVEGSLSIPPGSPSPHSTNAFVPGVSSIAYLEKMNVSECRGLSSRVGGLQVGSNLNSVMKLKSRPNVRQDVCEADVLCTCIIIHPCFEHISVSSVMGPHERSAGPSQHCGAGVYKCEPTVCISVNQQRL